MRSTNRAFWLVALLGLVACGEENPVDMGDLLPGGEIRTGEAVFEAPAFLAWDSVRGGFTRPAQADFVVAAGKLGGGLDAHALLRFDTIPRSLSYNDADGNLQVDTLANLVGGRLSIRLDTLRSAGSGPITIGVYQIAEDWDVGSASWVNRVDTGSVALPWAEAGGTRGTPVGTAQFSARDSVVDVTVDGSVLATLRDSADAARGLMIQVESPGARVEFRTARLFFEMRPELRPDTLFADSVLLRARTFVLDPLPDPGAADVILVGGVPAWRSYLHFREALDTLPLPCPGGPADCTVRLGDVTLNYAGIELQPITAFPGFARLDTTSAEPKAVLSVPGVPVARAPLGGLVGDRVLVPPTSSGAAVTLPVTMLIRALSGDSISRASTPRTMALMGAPDEGMNLGVGVYGSLAAGPLAPRLRLIYSVTKEVQDR